MVTTAPEPDKAVASSVHHWFGSRGVDVRYRPGLAAPLEAIPADPVDDLRTLNWLRAAVVPALSRLEERYPRADLIAFLFDGATLDDMADARRVIDGIRDVYACRGSATGSWSNDGSATLIGVNHGGGSGIG